ncbi:MAG TPA: tetratricopeptide repeat protein [Acetobacteraceae bacterium]
MTPGQEHHAAELLRRAREHLRAGRPTHAEALAEVALSWDAGSDAAMAVLGHTALLRGDHARAAALLAPAVAKRADAARCHDLGRALVGLGRRADAVGAFRQAAELAPQDGAVANDLGVVLAELGRVADAEAAFRRAVAVQPGSAEARDNLATAMSQLGRPGEAAALPMPPPEPESLEAAIALRPDDVELRRSFAQHLQSLGRFAEAEAELTVALSLAPDVAVVHADLGWVLRRQDRLDEALVLLLAAAERWPDDARVLNSLAIAVLNAGRVEEALALLERAAACDPDDAEVQHNRAMALLRLGRFAEGWDAYEWRWRMGQGRPVHRVLPQPLWAGEPLDGRAILLHAEQGLGDTLQFLRYVPLVAGRGGRVVLEVPAALGRLAARLPGVAELVWAGDPLPPFDLHCPLLSLPRAFGTTVATIPSAPYLTADPGLVAAWRERLGGTGLRVGLVWAGRPEHWDDARRSLPFGALAPLWAVPGVRWFSLQVGPRAADLASAPSGVMMDLAPMLVDFADTAAVLIALDLLVCVDTAVAHLAGALGRPAWLLLPHAADWRWMREADRTPWYPSLRLFRQVAPGAWDDVVGRVVAFPPLSLRVGHRPGG